LRILPAFNLQRLVKLLNEGKKAIHLLQHVVGPEIWVESVIGKGSQFIFTLPLKNV
jgi:hypothetical protein